MFEIDDFAVDIPKVYLKVEMEVINQIRVEGNVVGHYKITVYNEEEKDRLTKYLHKIGYHDYPNLTCPILFVNEIMVAPSYRRNGHGRSMLNEIMELISKNKIKTALLVADSSSHFDLIKWYESKGFKKITDVVGGPMMRLDLS